MITSWQAEVIAGYQEGSIVHAECLDRSPGTYSPTRQDDGTFTLSGYVPMSRYEIHELESSLLSDAVYNGDVEEEDADTDSPYAWVICDECGERIE